MFALLALGFPSPPQQSCLGWPLTITRRLIMQKASSHPVRSEVGAEPWDDACGETRSSFEVLDDGPGNPKSQNPNSKVQRNFNFQISRLGQLVRASHFRKAD